MNTGKPCCLTRQHSPESFSEDVQHKPDCLTTDVAITYFGSRGILFCVCSEKAARYGASGMRLSVRIYAKSNFSSFCNEPFCVERKHIRFCSLLSNPFIKFPYVTYI